MSPRPRRNDDSSSMFWFVRIFVMLALAAVFILGLGFLLPEERSAVKTTLIDAAPQRVYEIVTDVEKQTDWRSDLKSVHVERRGDLWGWTEQRSDGATLTVEELEKRPIERYQYSYVDSRGVRGRWLGQFEPSSEGRTKLTYTQTIVIENPLRRVAAYVLLNLDTLMDLYLQDLNRFASQPATEEEPLYPPPLPTTTAAPTAVASASPDDSARTPSEEPSVSRPLPTATPSVSPSPTIAPPRPTPSAAPSPSPLVPPITPPSPAPFTPPAGVIPSATAASPSSTSSPAVAPLPGSPTSLPPGTPSLLTAPLPPQAKPTPSATPTPTAAPTASASATPSATPSSTKPASP